MPPRQNRVTPLGELIADPARGHDGSPHVVVGDRLLRWTPAGYDARARRPAVAPLITPPSLVALLRTGWQPLVPLLHPSADRLRA